MKMDGESGENGEN